MTAAIRSARIARWDVGDIGWDAGCDIGWDAGLGAAGRNAGLWDAGLIVMGDIWRRELRDAGWGYVWCDVWCAVWRMDVWHTIGLSEV